MKQYWSINKATDATQTSKCLLCIPTLNRFRANHKSRKFSLFVSVTTSYCNVLERLQKTGIQQASIPLGSKHSECHKKSSKSCENFAYLYAPVLKALALCKNLCLFWEMTKKMDSLCKQDLKVLFEGWRDPLWKIFITFCTSWDCLELLTHVDASACTYFQPSQQD